LYASVSFFGAHQDATGDTSNNKHTRALLNYLALQHAMVLGGRLRPSKSWMPAYKLASTNSSRLMLLRSPEM